MTINYGPYEPPPPTTPPPPGLGPVGRSASPPAGAPTRGVGLLLALLGIGATVIGLFALPIQKYGPHATNDVYFGDVRRLVAEAVDYPYVPPVASALARAWWGAGLLAAVCVLLVLIAGMCVADSAQVRRPIALMTAAVAVGTGFLHWLAMVQTADTLSVTELSVPSKSLFHASGLGPWVAFMGLTATAISGLIAAFAGPRPPQQ